MLTKTGRRRPGAVKLAALDAAGIVPRNPPLSYSTGRPGGLLARFQAKQAALDPRYKYEHDANGNTYVPLDGEPHVRAVIRSADHERLTGREGPGLTKGRWWRDEDGMVRAFAKRPDARGFDFNEGLLIAALLLNLKDGDVLQIADPLDLRSGMKRVA